MRCVWCDAKADVELEYVHSCSKQQLCLSCLELRWLKICPYAGFIDQLAFNLGISKDIKLINNGKK